MPRVKKTHLRKRVAPKKRKSVFSQSSLGKTYGATKSLTSVASGAVRKVLLHGGTNFLLLTAASTVVFEYPAAQTYLDLVTQIQASTKWTTLAALYSEYRITGVRVRFVPVVDFNRASTQGDEPGIVLAWMPVFASPTYATVLDQEGSKIFSLHKDWLWFQKVSSVTGASSAVAPFDSCAAPATGAFGTLAATLTNGSTVGASTAPGFGTVAIDIMAEFRGMKA